MFYRVYNPYFGNQMVGKADTFNAAVDLAKASGFESTIYDYRGLMASWSPVSDLRMIEPN
jgi:predicted alpha/beta hydrolase